MATVKFSGDLRQQIINRAAQQFQGAVNTAVQSYPKDWGDRLYDIIFADVAPIMAQLPTEFFEHKDEMTVRSVGGILANIEYKLTPPRPFPKGYPADFRGTKGNSYSDDFALKDIPEFAEFKAEVKAWKARVNAATERQSEFKNSVSVVVNSYATLAPALKAWPPLWDLIPEKVKEHHKQIVERERKEVTLNVDLHKMTAMAAYTKIRGDKDK